MRLLAIALVVLLPSACVEGIVLAGAEERDIGVRDARGGDDLGVLDAAFDTSDVDGPQVAIAEPADGAEVEAGTVRVSGTAVDATGVATVFVQAGPNSAVPAQTDDGYASWWADVPSSPGVFEVRAWGYDVGGARTASPASVLLYGPRAGDDTLPPTIAITEPADGALVLRGDVWVRGTASDDVGVVRIDVLRNGEPLTDGRVETDSYFAEWARRVTLLPGRENRFEFVAVDRRGGTASATLTLTGRGVDDREPPTLQVASPTAGASVPAPALEVSGQSADAFGVRLVEARLETVTPDGGAVVGAWVGATSDDGYATFTVSLPVSPGEAAVTVRAIDQNGLTTTERRDVFVEGVRAFGPETTYRLRVRPSVPLAPTTLRIGRDRIGEVLSEDIQREILMLELDPGELLRNTMETIKSACGTAWSADRSDPRHDCSLTELGRTFRGSDGTWRTSAEYALVRLLTMTPANVQVAGTSIAGLQELADGQFFGIRLGGGFAQILADSLGISRTTEITSTAAVVEALRVNLIGTHPAATADGRMPVTLYDALQDMRPLGERFGPAAGHPGVVDPSSPTVGRVFEDDAALVLTARSNLQWFDGVDLRAGKEYFADVVDTTGPTFGDVLEFDFSSDETFRVEGLVDLPTTDMRFVVFENAAFVPSCNGSAACVSNLPGTPTGPASIWAQPQHQLEPIVTRAAFGAYRSRTVANCYINFLGCRAEVRVGQGGFPPGWTEFDIVLGLGNPPRDQYVWELIGEVAQVALHRVPAGAIAEGDADVAFDLRDVPVGITADELQATVRPYLQSQAAEISDLVLGDYRRNNGDVAFTLRQGDDGALYLFFVAPGDPLPGDVYPYTRPGFFSDASLDPGTKVSAMRVSGVDDVTHEKLRVDGSEQIVFAADADGAVWRLSVGVDPRDGDVVVGAARWLL